MNTQQLKKYKILLIGDDCVDVYQYGTVERISPEAPVPVFKFSHEERRPGMAGNVARNLEALGCCVNYLHADTSTKTRIVDIRSKQQIVRIDNDVISKPIEFETSIPNVYDAIIISDYNKGTVSYDLIISLIKSSICPVFIDTKKTDLASLNGAYIKINKLEARQATSSPNPKWLITTLGEDGAIWNGHTFSAETVEVADVTGAGDTFLAALVTAYLTNGTIEQAIPYAIRAAGITVQHLGVYAPTWDELA
jgi:D-beta-D-heptose 7-phosphate kinase/D-beta-D-heptose 1-phosphate adenosyltransferase